MTAEGRLNVPDRSSGECARCGRRVNNAEILAENPGDAGRGSTIYRHRGCTPPKLPLGEERPRTYL